MEATLKRHTLPNDKLNDIYRQIDSLIADLTFEEVQEHLHAINEVKTIIHQRINENNKKVTNQEDIICKDCVQFYWCNNFEKGKRLCESFKEKPHYENNEN